MASATDPLIPIARIVDGFFLFNLDDVKRCREQYGILGVFVGTLPQYNQQNVFLGLPQQIMPEDARLLVEMGVACLVDNVDLHTRHLSSLSLEERRRFELMLIRRGIEFAKEDLQRTEDNTKRALERMSPEKRAKVEAKLSKGRRQDSSILAGPQTPESLGDGDATPESPSTASPSHSRVAAGGTDSIASVNPRPITPTTSFPPLHIPASYNSTPKNSSLHSHRLSPLEMDPPAHIDLPQVASLSAYQLYKHLHSLSYFLSPGLRFGCQFCVYPGDPLRFHSHFLARAFDWDEEFDLLTLVGGGRLGTGVKKSFLVGGPKPNPSPKSKSLGEGDNHIKTKAQEVLTFCVEWAGM